MCLGSSTVFFLSADTHNILLFRALVVISHIVCDIEQKKKWSNYYYDSWLFRVKCENNVWCEKVEYNG